MKLNVDRLRRLALRALDTFSLDLTGMRILTEAGSGPYVMTPLLAAMAGGRVRALTRDSRYGSAKDVRAHTLDLASHWGLAVDVVTDRTAEYFADADIVTNLGFVRPIDRSVIDVLPPTAVIALMFEPWELRPQTWTSRRARSAASLSSERTKSEPNSGSSITSEWLRSSSPSSLRSKSFGPVLSSWVPALYRGGRRAAALRRHQPGEAPDRLPAKRLTHGGTQRNGIVVPTTMGQVYGTEA